MIVEIKVPSVGESITEAVLAQWYRNDGDVVKKDEPLFVIETDKVTLEVVAEAEGVLSISAVEGETVAIGAVVGTLDTEAAAKAAEPPKISKISEAEKPEVEPVEQEAEEPQPAIEGEPIPAAETPGLSVPEPIPVSEPTVRPSELIKRFAPSVRRLAAEKKVDLSLIAGTGPGGRITKGDVLLYLESGQSPASAGGSTSVAVSKTAAQETTVQSAAKMPAEELITRKPMTPIRRRIAERLLQSKQNTAMLTTFNEIDMSRVMDIRSQYKQSFKEKYGVNLGIMSFFIKASIEALKEFPQINAFVDGKDIIEHHYYHIGVAVGSERGLVVPVIRHADKLSFAEVELAIVDYVKKINENRLVLADLEGGTFTISNGGIYGSLLSTPILNMPQSGILGMHKIEKRPVVIDDEIIIRSMMYVALSYDHRIVDGREAVTFLKRIKECVENPERITMEI
ncbi:MAG: 2-oxoglutarate dehydrogenase complex dihydrolipoyllysine-residue succinyltransferase [Desulfobacterales bacterium]|nr:MAG: 2-oxoglutarate dehydrogenase complex dihydrolipoyllysine-residue succinyltransferase [Desulfobacterales bacterium]